jgi:hypothetical protein
VRRDPETIEEAAPIGLAAIARIREARGWPPPDRSDEPTNLARVRAEKGLFQ